MSTYELPVTFNNTHGQKLHGVLHFPKSGVKTPIVIMAHGFTDDKTGDNRLFVKFAREIAPRGIAVLRFDFAGSGDSEGDFAEITPRSEIEDLRSAIDFVCSLPEIDSHFITLLGYSLGGAVSIYAAAEDQRINAFIGWAPVSHPEATFQRILGKKAFHLAEKFGKTPCKNGDKQFSLQKDFFLDLQNLNPLSTINKISPRPILLIQGLLDEKVPPTETEILYRSARNPKEIHFVSAAGHSFAFFEDELFGITLEKLEEYHSNFIQRKTLTVAEFRNEEVKKNNRLILFKEVQK